MDTLREQVTLRYLETQYDRLLDGAVANAQLAKSLLTDLPRYTCVSEGSC